ncbi:Transcription factor tau subunit sfc1 [Vanrija pseudolonga]|uniref:Transcription factor tau subunit sfc1 n=1 Tax=Vanrija pseudolonga TaxID=143232 RepID=A0AAF0YEG8_9TREE|nr:Transcription factor tau subunit sfc1 [Vanrija pseudolonga]
MDEDIVPASPPAVDTGNSDSNAAAGPSTLPPPKASWGEKPLPRATYRSIEYPGPVAYPDLIHTVIRPLDIEECFNANIADARQLEMRYRGAGPEAERSAVPVRGTRVASQKMLVKLTKRRKKALPGQTQPPGGEGVFTVDVIGSIPQTVRFRSMADYQFTPAKDTGIAELTQALDELDYHTILSYKFPQLNEDFIAPTTPDEDGEAPPFPFRSLLELQPTPVASNRHLPTNFTYRNSSHAVVERIWDDELGAYKDRLVNKSRKSGWAMVTIGSSHPVPTQPEEGIRQHIPKLDKRIFSRLQELLNERPVWMRYSLLAQFSDADRYEIESNKMYLPAVAFTYGAGPFWKTLVRWGYDPCSDPAAHKYQRVYIYLDVKRGRNNVLNAPAEEVDEEEAKRPSFWWETEQERRIAEGLRPPMDKAKSYLFDGEILHRNKPDYQLIDITDPVILPFIYDPMGLHDTCDPHSGWYRRSSFELIKMLLRVRYMYLRDTNEPAPESSYRDVIDAFENAVEEGQDPEAIEGLMRRMGALRRQRDRERGTEAP